jgi:hypothetical protein
MQKVICREPFPKPGWFCGRLLKKRSEARFFPKIQGCFPKNCSFGKASWVFIVIVSASCGSKPAAFERSTPEEKWKILREYFLVPDAPVSNERPLPNVLSEQEILLKAADFAVKEGVLYPDYYAYQNNPALKSAKIETPILLTNASTGEPDAYILTAVDANGVSMATVIVSSNSGGDSASFIRGRSIAEPGGAYNHIMTKREAAELIQSQFPEGEVSEPMAVSNLRLGEDPHSHRGIFWYFTVDESEPARGAAGSAEEYILDADIPGNLSGGVLSNRAAIVGQGGSPYLGGYRMAKLNTPLGLHNKLNAARSAGGASFSPSVYPTERLSFTPVPLK